MGKDHKSRRQFLRNISLASISVGILPSVAKGSIPHNSNTSSPLDCDITTLDLYGEGPFYTANAPEIENNLLANEDEPGQRLIISGQARNLDCSMILANTIIDVWHTDDAGDYDNEGYHLRGFTYTNEQGFYIFETILPGHYLNGATYRPSHIHVKITPPGFQTLTTQLYFEGDEYIPTDAAASVTSGEFDATHRIIPLNMNNEGKLEGTWDIVVEGDGMVTGDHLHLERGMIYTAGPNPFSHQVEIKYGVFKEAKVGIYVYDLFGRTVAQLEENNLSPEKYSVTWQPNSTIPDGYYFIALKINDLQVHYLKVLKKS